jgi:glycerol-3-phosphate acyltransferase PlsY
LPAVAYFYPGTPVIFFFALGVAVFVIILHRANIGRLLQGTENRFVRKGDVEQAEQEKP